MEAKTLKTMTMKMRGSEAARQRRQLLKRDRRPTPEENYRTAFEGFILNYYSQLAF